MFKDFHTIKYLRKLSEKEINNKFLAVLRHDLAKYVEANPASQKISIPLFSRFQFFNMRYATVSLIVIVAIMSGGGVTLASLGSLPGDSLYPVKTFSEDLRSLLAFSPEAKQKLEEKLATKRIAEVQALMTTPQINQKNVDLALTRLDKHMDDVAKTIELKKNSGKNVEEITKKMNDDFNSQQKVLENIFRIRGLEMKNKLEDIKDDPGIAEGAGKATTTEVLIKELKKIDGFRNRVNRTRDIKKEKETIKSGYESTSSEEIKSETDNRPLFPFKSPESRKH